MKKKTSVTIKERLQPYRQIVLYLFFGACSMAVNIAVYSLCFAGMDMSNAASTVLAWLAAMLIAFVTNRDFVFESRRSRSSERVAELLSFLACRLLTGALDVAIMVAAVDYLSGSGVFWKIVSNIIVVIANYIASKFWIFRPGDRE
nr:GtrA family protein [uncultured Agathobaculum sp.]